MNEEQIKEALGADKVIPLPIAVCGITDLFVLRDWFDRRRKERLS